MSNDEEPCEPTIDTPHRVLVMSRLCRQMRQNGFELEEDQCGRMCDCGAPVFCEYMRELRKELSV